MAFESEDMKAIGKPYEGKLHVRFDVAGDGNGPNWCITVIWTPRHCSTLRLVGLIGTKEEATVIRQKIEHFLSQDLKLELNAEKTLITQAGDERAKFLGYEVYVLHADTMHDRQGRRSVNGGIGLRIPMKVQKEKCGKYMRQGKPWHIPPRIINDPYSRIAQYQSEFRGIVQYYKMAYNLSALNTLKHVMEVSLVKTLANKYKTTCPKIYRRYGTTIKTKEGEYKVLLVKVEREAPKKPLIAYFGGIPLKWQRWVSNIEERPTTIWNRRSEIVQRLLEQQCELCGSQEKIEVHHIRKLADLKDKGGTMKPEWKTRMSERKRKTLVVCQNCHNAIHQGQYDGRKLVA